MSLRTTRSRAFRCRRRRHRSQARSRRRSIRRRCHRGPAQPVPRFPVHLQQVAGAADGARLADSRIGHFATPKVDFSDESKLSPVRFYVQRWRLEKKDPSAAVVRAGQAHHVLAVERDPGEAPRTDPARHLEWNKAFEKAGFKDAIVVRQQPDDADFDLGETQYSSIRWMTTATPSFGAIGPSQVDPRTGEILDADIAGTPT